jgi:hypothetical protein
MANEKTEFIHVEKIRYWCNKILPLAYDDSLSYYEVLAKVQEKINELIQAHNELPDYIKEAVIKYAHSEEFNDYIKTIFANLVVNVKYPPAGLKAAIGDGVTNDSDAFQNVLDYCNANHRIMFIPDGKYVITRKLYMSYPVIGASDDTVYILAPKNTVVFSNETYETVTTTTPTTGEVVKTETKITGRSQIAKLKNVHCNPANIDFDADYIELIRVNANSVKLVSHQTSECTHLGCAHLETDGVGHNFENLVFSGTADPDIETNPLSFITHCGNLNVRSTTAGTGRVVCVFDDKAVYPISSAFIGDCAPTNQKFYDEFNAPCATYLSRTGEWTIVRGENRYQVTITKIANAYEIMATNVTLKGNPDLNLKVGDQTLIQYHGSDSITRPKETLLETAKNINRTATASITDTAPAVNINGSSSVTANSGGSNITVKPAGVKAASGSNASIEANANGVKAAYGSNSSIEANANGVKAAYGSNTSVEVNASGAFVKDGDSAVEVKTDEGATLRDGSNVFVKVAGEQGVFIEGDNKPIDIHGNEVNASADTVAVTGPTEVNVASKNLKLHDSNEANNWGITGTTGLSGDGAINLRTNTATILTGGKRIVAKPVSEADVKAGIDLTARKSIIYNPSFQVPAKFNDYFNYVSAPDATGSNTSKLLFAGDKLAELLPGGGGGGESVVVDVTNAGENSLVAGDSTTAVATANSQKLNALAQTGNILYFPGGLVYNFGANDKVSAFHGITSYKNGMSARLVNLDLQSLTHENSTVVLDGFEIDHVKISNRMVDIKNCRLKTDSNIMLDLCTGSISNCSTFGDIGLRPDIYLTNCASMKIDSLQNYYNIVGSFCGGIKINNCELNTVALGDTNDNVRIINNFFSSDSAEQSILAISGIGNNEADSIFIANNTFYHTNEIAIGGYMLSLTSCKNTFITNNAFQNIDQTNDKPIILSGVGIFAFNTLDSQEQIANIISAGACDVFHNYNGSWA